jgi:hypothetical protein
MADEPRSGDTTRVRETARVDYLVDENGSRIELPHEDEGIRAARDDEPNVGGTGPTNWWRLGIVVLGAIVLVLLLLQVFGGNGAHTDVVPGTPVVQGQPPVSPSP